ncbi:MAG: tetratricopeptide (TPR) repeat protein, partial [Candidatus Promineifilaceae bacterium]
SDAYCIQSRLAIQLEQTGNFAEAAKRYETAYELMPDSFGRIESHCFGCEGVFRTDRAQGIAERVFISLTKKTPEKPQVHYLLGYLRSQQGRYAEAAALFEKATTLDPDYLNAWNKRNEMARHIKPNPEQRDNTVINMLRLDPLQRHHSADLSQVVDLRRVAAAFAQSDALRVESPKTIYALPASAKKVAEMEEKMKAMGDSSHHYSRSYYRDSQTFAQRLLQHQVIQSAIQLQSISSEMSGYGGYGFGF